MTRWRRFAVLFVLGETQKVVMRKKDMDTFSFTFTVNKMIFYQNCSEDNVSPAFQSSIMGVVTDSDNSLVDNYKVQAFLLQAEKKLEHSDCVGKCILYEDYLWFEFAIPWEDWERIESIFTETSSVEKKAEISVLLNLKEFALQNQALPIKQEIEILCIETEITYEKNT